MHNRTEKTGPWWQRFGLGQKRSSDRGYLRGSETSTLYFVHFYFYIFIFCIAFINFNFVSHCSWWSCHSSGDSCCWKLLLNASTLVYLLTQELYSVTLAILHVFCLIYYCTLSHVLLLCSIYCIALLFYYYTMILSILYNYV